MQSHSVHLVARMDPIKYLFDKPSLSMRLSKWSFFLAEFDIKYMTRKSVKGRVLAEQLADFPSTEEGGLEPPFPDEGIFSLTNESKWQLFFDGAANKRGNGIGMLLIDPKDEHTPIAIKLNFEVTNNAAEYEACVTGLEATLERNVKELEVYGDSALIINQVSNKWRTIDPGLQKYHTYMEELISQSKKSPSTTCQETEIALPMLWPPWPRS
jgi:ribonuclease HI